MLTCSDQWAIEVSDGITLTDSAGPSLPPGTDGRILVARRDDLKPVILRPNHSNHRAYLSLAPSGEGHESWLLRISGGIDVAPLNGNPGGRKLTAQTKAEHDIVAVDLMLPGEIAFGAIKKVPGNPRFVQPSE